MTAILLSRRNSAGLTLIEVLIALAIVSIALTAIIKATSQNIRATSYLQNKTTATWVGQQVINETRARLRTLPGGDDKLKQSTMMFNQKWYWQAYQENTPNSHIKLIKVDVFTHEDDDAPIVSLESYVYRNDD